MTESRVVEEQEGPISDDEAQEVDGWKPPPETEEPALTLEEHELGCLLLALEKAVLDCRQASQEVKSLLPSMNAVAQSIERAAMSPMRLVLAGCGGALASAVAMWILHGGLP